MGAMKGGIFSLAKRWIPVPGGATNCGWSKRRSSKDIMLMQGPEDRGMRRKGISTDVWGATVTVSLSIRSRKLVFEGPTVIVSCPGASIWKRRQV